MGLVKFPWESGWKQAGVTDQQPVTLHDDTTCLGCKSLSNTETKQRGRVKVFGTVSQIVLRFAPKWFACSELLNLQLLHWKVLGKCKLSDKVNLIKAEYFCNGHTVITKAFVGKDV